MAISIKRTYSAKSSLGKTINLTSEIKREKNLIAKLSTSKYTKSEIKYLVIKNNENTS